MKAVLLLHLAILGLVGAEAGLKVLKLELSRVSMTKDEPTVQGELAERGMSKSTLSRPDGYAFRIRIGKPQQIVWVTIQTASSMTWVTYRKSILSKKKQTYKGFSHWMSLSSSRKKDDKFSIDRLTEPDIYGDMICETVRLNSTVIKNMTLGAIHSSKPDTIGGLGLAAKNRDDQSKHPIFLDYLKKLNIISRRAYSLYSNLDSKHDILLLGGIDTTKFIGELAVLRRPLNASDRQVEGFFVGLSGIDIATPNLPNLESVQIDVPAKGIASLLDSSAKFSYLPSEILWQIASRVNAFYEDENPLLLINCRPKKLPNPKERVTLTLPRANGGEPMRINIPLADLVIDLERQHSPPDVCQFGIQASYLLNHPTDFAIFGRPFLQSMYVVGDIDSDQIAVAPINPQPNGQANIGQLPASGDGIPALRGVDPPNE